MLCINVWESFTDPCTLSHPVELRNTEQHLCRNVFVHDPEHDGRRGGEEEVEENHQPVVDHGGAGEATEELIPEQQVDVGLGDTRTPRRLDKRSRHYVSSDGSDDTHHILIEEVNDHVGQSSVAPVPVNQEQLFQVLEARYGKIARHDRLRTTESLRKSEQEKKQ